MRRKGIGLVALAMLIVAGAVAPGPATAQPGAVTVWGDDGVMVLGEWALGVGESVAVVPRLGVRLWEYEPVGIGVGRPDSMRRHDPLAGGGVRWSDDELTADLGLDTYRIPEGREVSIRGGAGWAVRPSVALIGEVSRSLRYKSRVRVFGGFRLSMRR